MANSKYNQVADLLATGKLNWAVDDILGVLCQDVAFNASQLKLSDALSGGGTRVATTQIQGRAVVSGGLCLGYHAFFPAVEGGVDYQMLLVQNKGDGDPSLLGFYDEDEAGAALSPQNDGTFVLRPGAPDPSVYSHDTQARLWMVV